MKKKRKKLKLQKFILILALIILSVCLIKIIAKRSSINASNNKQGIDIEEVTEESAFPEEVFGVPVYTQLIEENTKARPGTKRKIKYIVIHETDNFAKGADAQNHAKFLSENNTESTSWHYTVDDKEIYHHIPDNEIAYHAATEDGNLHGIGVELCVNKDGKFNKTFDNATKLVAYLLKEYNLTTKDIKTHHDFSGKDCPHSILEDNRMGEFIKKVQNYYE